MSDEEKERVDDESIEKKDKFSYQNKKASFRLREEKENHTPEEEKGFPEKGFFKTILGFIRNIFSSQPEKKSFSSSSNINEKKNGVGQKEEKSSYQDTELNDAFHYQRGSFRKFEQKTYSDLATGVTGPTRGLFKVLFVSKGNRITFFTVIICAAVVLILGLVSGKPNEASFLGFNTHLTSFSFDGRVYAQVEFSPVSKETDTNPIQFDVLFEAVNTDNVVSDKNSFTFNLDPSSPQNAVCIFSDYDIKVINCTLRSEDEIAILKCGVSGK